MKKRNLLLLASIVPFMAIGVMVGIGAKNIASAGVFGQECTHSDLRHHDPSAPTESEIGKNREYWICCECHKIFSDSAATNEITTSIDLAKKTAATLVTAPEDGDLITKLVNTSTSDKLKGLDQTDWATYPKGKGNGTVNYYEIDGKKAMYLSGSLASNTEHQTAINTSNSGYAEWRYDLTSVTSVTFDYKYYDLDSSVFSDESHTHAQFYDGSSYKKVPMDLINDNQWHTITIGNTHDINARYFIMKVQHFEGEIYIANMSINEYDYNYKTYGATLNGATDGVSVSNNELKYQPTSTYSAQKGCLPTVNYTKYGSVSFTLSGNAHYGFSMEKSIWDESNGIHGGNITANVKVIYLGSNKLFVSTTANGVTLTNIVENADISAGTSGLPFYFSVSEGDTSMRVSVPTFENSIFSESNAGHIDYYKGGAHYEGDIYTIENGATVASGAVAYTPDQDYTCFEVTLPGIDFTKYGKATFPVYFVDAAYGVAFARVWEDSRVIYGTKLLTTLTITKVSDTDVKVTISDGTNTLEKTVSDADVIAGTKGVTFVFGNSSKGACYVMTPTLVEGHVHNYVVTSGAIGGQLQTKCSACGEDGESRAYTDSDLDYNKFKFGADLFAGWSLEKQETSNVTVVDNKLKYGKSTEYAKGKIILPYVNFAAYSKVEFDVETFAYYGINLASPADWDTAEYRGGTVCNGKLEIVVNGENNLTVNFYVTAESTTTPKWTTTITDSGIYSGTAGVPFYANIPEGSDYVTVSLPALTAK